MLPAESGCTALAAILEVFDGDRAAVDELLAAALHTFGESLDRIELASGETDRDAIAQSAHRLKGAAATVGGTRVAAVSSLIERAAREGQPIAPSLLIECREAVTALNSEIHGFLSTASAGNG
ncbi:MAG: Hpt domain-containing protein [Candidatus Eremiobacteraeota bacterium]|nr:Hpt domain-containing protein [Candidatus Eremiobacteraeota bacterium]MBC5820790.1 Hpt domain-containing protein [Candidatus Eremiobacteraeota bacterium]